MPNVRGANRLNTLSKGRITSGRSGTGNTRAEIAANAVDTRGSRRAGLGGGACERGALAIDASRTGFATDSGARINNADITDADASRGACNSRTAAAGASASGAGAGNRSINNAGLGLSTASAARVSHTETGGGADRSSSTREVRRATSANTIRANQPSGARGGRRTLSGRIHAGTVHASGGRGAADGGTRISSAVTSGGASG